MNEIVSESEKIWRPAENVVTRKIVDETILVPISGNLANMQRIFSVNELGAFIWGLLDGERSVRSIKQTLMEAFDVDEDRASADLSEFIDRLHQAGLVSERSV